MHPARFRTEVSGTKRLSLDTIALLSLLALEACGSALRPAAAPAPGPKADETRYTFLLAGNQAGSAVTRSPSSAERIFDFEFNDRGRGPKTTTQVRLDAQALLDAPGGRLPVLPTGRPGSKRSPRPAPARSPWTSTPSPASASRRPTFGSTGSGTSSPGSPAGLWPCARGEEAALPELTRIQDETDSARLKGVAARLAQREPGGFAVRGARLFAPETRATFSDTTVVVSGNRIQAVGRDSEVQIPAGMRVIDARGKTLLPGLWDMHTHVGDDAGILNLAAGVTSVRDLANDTDQLLARRKRWDTGETLGPRVLMAGFIDGSGPFAGPTKVLVDTEEEALAAVGRYAELGYVQVKLYSSLDPKLVPAIIRRAHERGLRVSGHIPNGMTAEEAVRAGFDEVQHANFFFLNFISGVDTRTPARVSEVAKNAADLDWSSQHVRDFIALLKERKTAWDPTIVTFEGFLTGRPGEMNPSMVAVAPTTPWTPTSASTCPSWERSPCPCGKRGTIPIDRLRDLLSLYAPGE